MNELAQFEENFRTAIDEGYVRNMGLRNLERIEAASGRKCDNKTCNSCILDFIRLVGRDYFRELKAREVIAQLDEIMEEVPEPEEEKITKKTPAKNGAKNGAKKAESKKGNQRK